MTMADTIAVMNAGRIEQLGSPDELYERPKTAFVAGFLGVSNLLEGVVVGDEALRIESGEIHVPREALAGRTGRVAAGIRPEKIRLGDEGENVLRGRVVQRAYIGVSTEYIVETPAGRITVFIQNADRAVAALEAGDALTLSWSPEATFVVDPAEKEELK